MTTLTIDEIQARLPEVLRKLAPGEEILITENNQSLATLVGKERAPVTSSRPGPGICKGMVEMTADFDAPLEDLKEYME